MNASIFKNRCVPRFLAPALLVLFLVGCSTTPKIDWASRVGNYTYDQAVLELGPPESMAKLTDSTLVADWLTRRGYSHGFVGTGAGWGPGYGTYAPVPAWQPYTSSTSPAEYLRLTFGPDGKLISWKKVSK